MIRNIPNPRKTRYVIRHIPSGMYRTARGWSEDLDAARIYNGTGQARNSLARLREQGEACAPPYELVPLRLVTGTPVPA